MHCHRNAPSRTGRALSRRGRGGQLAAPRGDAALGFLPAPHVVDACRVPQRGLARYATDAAGSRSRRQNPGAWHSVRSRWAPRWGRPPAWRAPTAGASRRHGGGACRKHAVAGGDASLTCEEPRQGRRGVVDKTRGSRSVERADEVDARPCNVAVRPGSAVAPPAIEVVPVSRFPPGTRAGPPGVREDGRCG